MWEGEMNSKQALLILWFVATIVLCSLLFGCASKLVPYDQQECEASKNWQFNYVTNYSEEELRQIEYYTRGVCTGGFTIQ